MADRHRDEAASFRVGVRSRRACSPRSPDPKIPVSAAVVRSNVPTWTGVAVATSARTPSVSPAATAAHVTMLNSFSFLRSAVAIAGVPVLVAFPSAPVSFVSISAPVASLKKTSTPGRACALPSTATVTVPAAASASTAASATAASAAGVGVGSTTSRPPASRSIPPKLPLPLSSHAKVARRQSVTGARKTTERRTFQPYKSAGGARSHVQRRGCTTSTRARWCASSSSTRSVFPSEPWK